MPTPILHATKQKRPRPRYIAHKLHLSSSDTVEIIKLVRSGFPYKRLAIFQKATQLPWTEISRFVAIPSRTLSRRQSEGKLQPDESDRVWRAITIFDQAVELFEGDATAARNWLQTPQSALNGETPLDFASTEVGAREVEHLIGRLEHGVFT